MPNLKWTVLLLASCRAGDPGPAPARRLTGTEYNNTVRDLLGFDLDDEWPASSSGSGLGATWPWDFPTEPTQLGFEGMTESQTASAVLVESYASAAMHFAGYAEVAPAFWVCVPDDRDEACAWDSIERLATRAYRRPLLDEERLRLRRGLSQLVDEAGLLDGVQLTIVALLMSPQVLYRLEHADAGRGDIVPLTSWELASRMSYFLWESMPDAALFEAASSDALQDPTLLAKQSNRMLQDQRAAAMMGHFHEQWLDLDAVYSSRPDMYTYAEQYLPGLLSGQTDVIFIEDEWSGAIVGTRKAMHAEARLFLSETVQAEGTLSALLTSDRGYASWLTADVDRIVFSTGTLYGVLAPEGEPVYQSDFTDGKMRFTLETHTATYPPDQRAGVLTLGAMLMGRAHPIHPSPIQRGVFILERLACEDLGTPPDGAEGALPADSADLDGTNRARTAAITSGDACAGCHEPINSVGFALEAFDSLGAWRTTDNSEPIDASGTLSLSGGEVIHFDSATALAAGLAASRQVHDCYAQQWMRYALGREVLEEEPGAQAVKDAFFESGGDIATLLRSIVQTELFRTRRSAP